MNKNILLSQVLNLATNDNILEEKTLYHGSPYKFDNFSLKYMGKGEGKQAFGWGLYFAEDREIADKAYKERLTTDNKVPPDISINGNIWSTDQNNNYMIRNDINLKENPNSINEDVKKEYSLIEMLKDSNYDVDKLKNFYQKILDDINNNIDSIRLPMFINRIINSKSKEYAIEYCESIINFNIKKFSKNGFLYTIEIPDNTIEDYFLDYDTGLEYQNSKILEKLANLFKDLFFKDDENSDTDYIIRSVQYHFNLVSGREIYELIRKKIKGHDKDASMKLLDYDIYGLYYADGNSRNTMGAPVEKSLYNFVVWNDNIIKIINVE